MADVFERVHELDERIEKHLEPHRSPALDAFFYRLSSAADHGLVWMALGTLHAARKRDAKIALRVALVLGAESALTNGLVKSLFNRVRPPDHFEHDGPLPHGMHRPITTSFPSGHAATAFTAATLLSDGTNLGPLYFSLAALVASSRVYVRMHHTSDVVAGALLGVCLGQIARAEWPPSALHLLGVAAAGVSLMGMTREIAVTFDYRCPFARNGHEAVINAVREGKLTDVEWRYMAFSLDQAHAEEGEAPVWEREPGEWGTGTLALLYGIAVRDNFPDQFFDAHLALFAARHDQGLKLGHEDVVRDAVASAGLDPDAVAAEAWSGRPLKTLAEEHTEAVEQHAVFGVPTYIEGDESVFIRFMERGRADDLERAMDLMEFSRLNEFKRTKIAR